MPGKRWWWLRSSLRCGPLGVSHKKRERERKKERERERERKREKERERETEARIISDSSSCRAFSQRQGVGRLKHINVKHLWLQEKIKECALQMDGVPTVLNIADLGTKRLAKAQRDFLMFLINLVKYDGSGRRCFQLLPAEESSWKQDEISGTGDAEIPHGIWRFCSCPLVFTFLLASAW